MKVSHIQTAQKIVDHSLNYMPAIAGEHTNTCTKIINDISSINSRLMRKCHP